MKHYRCRIYFRTLRFVSMYWAAPFFLGMGVSIALVTYAESEIFHLLADSFDHSFREVIKSCAQ